MAQSFSVYRRGNMRLIDTKDAVGHMLCHDITQIIKGEKKGPVFRKGHIIRAEDVEVLRAVGKDHIYIWEVNENTAYYRKRKNGKGKGNCGR